MKIILASDRAGAEIRDKIADYLSGPGHEVNNIRGEDVEKDYPDAAALACRAIQKGEAELGILVCGTGIGMSITANKFRGIRAALLCDEYSARMSASHNNANVLCFGARTQGPQKIFGMLDAYFGESFLGGRHGDRVAKIHRYEEEEKNR